MNRWTLPSSTAGQIVTPREQVEGINLKIVALTFTAVAYNAMLAFLNARGLHVSFAMAAATEMLILCAGVYMLMKDGIKKSNLNVLYFIGAFVVIALIMSLLNQRIFVDALRNMLIIALFVCLGRNSNQATVIKVFSWCTLLVLAVLVLELSSLTTYAKGLNPASYFVNSRGMAVFEYDDSGIFRNALGFANRFSYGLFSGPRTSSIFLEQVSLANYAAILGIFLISVWPSLPLKLRVLHMVTIFLIVTSNNTRMTSILTLMTLIGYYAYPRLPRYLPLALPPILIAIALTVYSLYPENHSDTFVGRISVTGDRLANMGIPEMFGMGIDQLGKLMDSGYAYVAFSSTVLGLFLLCFFITFIVPQNSPAQRRCGYALGLYFFLNLLVSGTAIFSIKVAAPLWLLVGMMSSPQRSEVSR